MKNDYDKRIRRANNKLGRVARGELLLRSDSLATAFHEGTHCIFGEAFGLTIESATCLSFSDSEGNRYCGMVYSNSNKVSLPANLHLIQDLSGDIAEWFLFEAKPYKPGIVSSGDANALVLMLNKMNIDSLEKALRLYESMAYQAKELVQKSQHWIRSLGVELYARKTMSGDEVREFLHQINFYEADNLLVGFAKSSHLAAEQRNEYDAMRKQQVEKKGEAAVRDMERTFMERFANLPLAQQKQIQREVLAASGLSGLAAAIAP